MLTFHIKFCIHIRNNTRRFLSIISNHIYIYLSFTAAATRHIPRVRGCVIFHRCRGFVIYSFHCLQKHYFLVDFCGKKYILSQQLTYIYLFGENRKLLIIVRKMTTAQIGLNQSTNCIGFHSSNIDSLIVIN